MSSLSPVEGMGTAVPLCRPYVLTDATDISTVHPGLLCRCEFIWSEIEGTFCTENNRVKKVDHVVYNFTQKTTFSLIN